MAAHAGQPGLRPADRDAGARGARSSGCSTSGPAPSSRRRGCGRPWCASRVRAPSPLFAVSPHLRRGRRRAFAQRRKTLRNALRELVSRGTDRRLRHRSGRAPRDAARREAFNTLAQTLDRRTGAVTLVLSDATRDREEHRHVGLSPHSAGRRPDRRQPRRSAARAQALATAVGAEVELLHVVEFVPVEPMGETLMPSVQIEDELLERAGSACAALATELGMPGAACRVEAGNVKSEIVRVARERHADLIVLGSRERHGLSILVNFTEDTVLHAAPCDVLAVRVGARRVATVSVESIAWRLRSTRSGSTSRPATSTSSPTRRSSRYVFSYTITHPQRRPGAGAPADAALGHHRCERQGAGSARRRRGRRAAPPEARARAFATPAAR